MNRKGVVAILPAAGQGRRLGTAKQFLELDGAPLLLHAARSIEACASISSLIVAAPSGEEERVEAILRDGEIQKLHRVVAGGEERADSVRAALAARPADATLAVIHDAARPFASASLFDRVIAEARRSGAAIAAIPCTDTVKEAQDRKVARTVDRSLLWLAQTPQAFRIDWLLEAYDRAGEGIAEATDEASLLEGRGMEIALVEGEKENFKVTDREDWERARAKVEAPFVVGFGYDVHAFEAGRPCVLGGLTFPGEVGLAGHSDADVVLHAVMDGILGAAGLGDIGLLFPDTDERYRGAASSKLLEVVVERAREAGFQVANVDLTIAAGRPKIGPRREEMRRSIASLLGVQEARVNVKATTTEGLGFVGRQEGIACQAVALLRRA